MVTVDGLKQFCTRVLSHERVICKLNEDEIKKISSTIFHLFLISYELIFTSGYKLNIFFCIFTRKSNGNFLKISSWEKGFNQFNFPIILEYRDFLALWRFFKNVKNAHPNSRKKIVV